MYVVFIYIFLLLLIQRKPTAKMFAEQGLDKIFLVIEPLLVDSDKYKQRAGAEILSGILRGE